MIKNLIPQRVKNVKHFFIAHFYNLRFRKPSKKLKVIGVTGTDGKTTTSIILYTMLKLSGKKVGLISTINAKIDKKEYPLAFHVTNPDPKDLQNFLKMMVDSGLEYAVLETTSHGLDQYRVAGINYEFAVYTNVTHEHLDYHKTYENYLGTKAKLISYTKKDGTVILNRDDESFSYLSDLSNKLERKTITYGFSKNSDILADEIITEKKYMNFAIKVKKKEYKLKSNLKGRYNVSNIMASIAVALELGIPMKDIKKHITQIPQLEGRWEVLQEKPFKVVVDFAHTPNSLENVLKRGDLFKTKNSNLIVVFGCAGKRDYSKRPKMGKIAGQYADKIILTAEDPRGEDVEKINAEIFEGIQSTPKGYEREYHSVPDRKEAIEKAINLAQKDDTIIITGKGHEKSMNLNGREELPWDEKKVTQSILKKRKA
jgi:UDP-N-acetylmuramoyl-L-alanyl-D-glutamate--2,6-diaminopimelate ligase